MKTALLLVLALVGCASGPPVKVPDGSHRVPVNSVVPPEAGGESEAPRPWRSPKAGPEGR
jgi:hypothetical protein